jgi:hypothetical protein
MKYIIVLIASSWTKVPPRNKYSNENDTNSVVYLIKWALRKPHIEALHDRAIFYFQ